MGLGEEPRHQGVVVWEGLGGEGGVHVRGLDSLIGYCGEELEQSQEQSVQGRDAHEEAQEDARKK